MAPDGVTRETVQVFGHETAVGALSAVLDMRRTGQAASQEPVMNIIYKGVCEQCKAEIIVIMRNVRTLEKVRGRFTHACLICERSEVILEMQGLRGDTA
jgi:hypothetical protein